jgi:hypothetical protein
MGKRVALVLLLVFVMVSTAGCAEGIFHVTVNRDGSADLNYKVGFDNSFYSLMSAMGSMGNNNSSSNSDPLSEYRQQFQSDGFTVANFNDGQSTGIVATKHLTSVNELSSSANNLNLGQNNSQGNSQSNSTPNHIPITVTKTFFSTEYNLDTNFDLSSLADSSQNEFSGLTNAMLSQIKLQLLVTLPIKPGLNNAANTLDNGRTLEWDLIPGQNNQIQMEATVPNVLNIAATAVGAVIIIALVIFLILRTRKKAAPPSRQNTDEGLDRSQL